MLIAIDIGNTNILIGTIGVDGDIHDQYRISTNDFIENKESIHSDLVESLKIKNNDNNEFIIASVVPNALSQISAIFNQYQVVPKIIKTTDPILGMKIDIDKPEELGTDRIINAIAAYEEFGGPLIIIDFGTATTFDIVDSVGTYKGGLICPGIKLSIKSLNSETAQLPLIDLKSTPIIVGRDTKTAIESGIYWGYVSLIEGLIEKVSNEMQFSTWTVVGTGGLSHIFKKDIKKINYFNDDLTLKGLYLINKKYNEQK